MDFRKAGCSLKELADQNVGALFIDMLYKGVARLNNETESGGSRVIGTPAEVGNGTADW